MRRDKTNNPFKRIESTEQVPEELKEKVMASINLVNLVGEFGDLFTAKLGGTATKMVDIKEKKLNSSGKGNN